MSTKIKTFKGKDGTVLLPRTHLMAVVNDSGTNAETLLAAKADKTELTTLGA